MIERVSSDREQNRWPSQCFMYFVVLCLQTTRNPQAENTEKIVYLHEPRRQMRTNAYGQIRARARPCSN